MFIDHAGETQPGVEIAQAEQQRRDAASYAAGVDHQYHRSAQQARQGGAAVAAFQIDAVVQSLVALDNRDVGAGGVAAEQRADLCRRHGVVVEVAAGASRRDRQPERVDVVRPFLERLHGEAPGGEGGAQADRHGCLA